MKEADGETCIFGFTIPQTEKKVAIITALRLYDQEEYNAVCCALDVCHNVRAEIHNPG